MKERKVTEERVARFGQELRMQERSGATIERYLREVERFRQWLPEDAHATRERTLCYKEELRLGRSPAGANAAIAALNGFFAFSGWSELKLRSLRLQRRAFCDAGQELKCTEYERLVAEAEARGDERLSLLLQTVAATGIRISELSAVTAEAVERGVAVVQGKGKAREILLPQKLRRKLTRYLRAQGRSSGPVFVTRTGRPLDRSNVWKAMKRLGAQAQVEKAKIFPHNLRHLFARQHYDRFHDLVRLADLLGHSSVNTTRIYTVSSGREHARQLEQLGLVI